MIGFKWIIENEIAGSSQPGLYSEWEDDIVFLKNRGIDYIVSLTEKPLIQEMAKDAGFGFLHLSIRDMYSPMPRTAHSTILQMHDKIVNGHKLLIHCKGGVGRTGMIGAAYLVYKGLSPEEAIKKVRSVNSSYIQTKNQEQFLTHYASFIRNSELI